MSIFIITSGHYSDYTVHGYCTSEDAAKKYCAFANTENKWDLYEYREIDCFDDFANEVEKIYYKFSFFFVRHEYKNVWSIYSRSDETLEVAKPSSCVKFVKAQYASEKDGVKVSLAIDENNSQRAEKAAFDMLYKWLAEQENL